MPVQVGRHEARRQNRVDLGAEFHFQLVPPSTSKGLGHAIPVVEMVRLVHQ